MSAPPAVPSQRKVKLVNALKAVHSDQISKLQAKVQLEYDLLEDIKTYTKLRAAAEKDYANALQKIATTLLSKFNNKDQNKEEEIRTPYGLWRRILEETEAAATTRMNVSQKLLTDVTESVKTLKPERVAIVKQCSALSEKLQEEMIESATELAKASKRDFFQGKAQKTYTELQKTTQQANEQLCDLEQKVKKGSSGLFSSKSKLEKNLSKATERRDVAEKRSTVGRNDYLISLAATNAHQTKYYGSDLPDLLATQDGDIYERLKEYYVSIVNTDLDALNHCIGRLTQVDTQVKQLERAFAIQLFLQENPVFTKCTPFEFVPAAGDKTSTISKSHGAELALNKEARKWTTKLAKEQKLIRKKTRELKKLQVSANADTNVTDVNSGGDQTKTAEPTVESITEELRHHEVLRTKSEARVEALRQAGVNVDEWLGNSNTNEDDETEDEINENVDNEEYGEEEWDEPSIANSYSDDALSISSSQEQRTLAVALYAFQATSQEELSIYDGEELEVIESEGDGWCRTKNKNGQIGFVPETYIEVKQTKTNSSSVDSDRISRCSTISGPSTQTETYQEIPIINYPVPSNTPITDFVCYAKAIYDYEACEDEELTFDEGEIILVTNKIVDDDDGWWEGILNGKRGVFPSIVVEEMKTNDDINVLADNRPRLNTSVDHSATFPRGREDMRRVRSMEFEGAFSQS